MQYCIINFKTIFKQLKCKWEGNILRVHVLKQRHGGHSGEEQWLYTQGI